MKKLLGFAIFTTILLSGCGKDPFTTENLDTIVDSALGNDELIQYLKTITYEQTERYDPEEDRYPYYYYDILTTLDDSFDELTPKEQFEFLIKVGKVIQKNSGTPQEINESGEFFCGEGIKCEFGSIYLKTSNHEYYADYNLPTLSIYLHKDDRDKSYDERNIIYDGSAKDGIYVDPSEKRKLQVDEQPEEIGLSESFSDYNQKYYTAYKNSLDLIGSNFELIYEGYGSADLIDDIVIWTTEFNELLDAYEQDAKPLNEKDKQLYSITEQMISEQREANKHIINGLENNESQQLIIAGEYLNKVVELYIEGNSFIK